MERENVADLIRKLLALSQSSNENEAALAMSKAQALLIKYNLDMAEIKAKGEEAPDDESMLINEDVTFDQYGTWQRHLVTVLSNRNFCHSIRTVEDGAIRILGRKANVRAVVEMYNWLEPQIIRLAVASGCKYSAKTSYCYGIIETIGSRLTESKEDYLQANTNCRALVANVQQESDGWYNQCYPTRSTRNAPVRNTYAYQCGRSDGHGVSLYGRTVTSGAKALGSGH